MCGNDPKTTLVPILDEIAAVGSKVFLDLRAEVVSVMQTNTTSDWEYLRSIIDAVQDHAAVYTNQLTLTLVAGLQSNAHQSAALLNRYSPTTFVVGPISFTLAL